MNALKPTLMAVSLFAAIAYPAAADNLMDIYQAARLQDPTYASAAATYQANIEAYPQARAALLPQVSATGATTWNDSKTDLFAGGTANSQYNTNSLVVTAKQSLYNQANYAALEQGKLTVDLAEIQLKSAKQSLILRVAQAYFNVLAAMDKITYINQQKAAISQQLAQAKASFEVGTATITDTNEAQAKYDLMIATEIAAQNDLAIKQETLRQLAGKPFNGVAPLVNTNRINLKGSNLDWQNTAQQDSLAVKAGLIQKSIAEEEIKRVKAGHLPTLDLVANSGRSTTHGSSSPGRTNYNNIGLQLTIPIYSGGSVTSQSRAAVAKDEAARQDLEAARRSALQDANTSYLGVVSGEAQVKALEQALVSADSVLKSTKLGQEVGVRTNIDVLNAQQSYFSAQNDLSAARYSYLLSYLSLKSVAGQLDEADVAEINQRLGN
ncbi:TolC family outer membrane protein [Leeia sp. TBRC 13508]|uniref:TolC family outer membrane protein n=1 Tax=Leeia speluncae TaxID=2884804 RepID=A0ABS8D6N1_9NEIS|nr:TolC family outer membrane protein [Leeia speluncae]MCB6183855.1 TolC family outer membrane protein [Leeia speluncae]